MISRESVARALEKLARKEKMQCKVSGTRHAYIRYRRALKEIRELTAEIGNIRGLLSVKHIGSTTAQEIEREIRKEATEPAATKQPLDGPVNEAPARQNITEKDGIKKRKKKKGPGTVYYIGKKKKRRKLPVLFSRPQILLLALSAYSKVHGAAECVTAGAIRYVCLEYLTSNRTIYSTRCVAECTDRGVKTALRVLIRQKLVSPDLSLTADGEYAAEASRSILEHTQCPAQSSSIPEVGRKSTKPNAVLLIDNREKKEKENPYYFQHMLTRLGVHAETRHLTLSDFIWCRMDGVSEKYGGAILERKTIRDLLASLRDGRYKEQRRRLGQVPGTRIYLIEGEPPKIAPAVISAVFTVQISLVLSGFLVLRTESAEHTVGVVRVLHETIEEGQRRKSETSETAEEVEEILQRSRKKRIEEHPEKERSVAYLSNIRGISIAAAVAVVSEIGSVPALLKQSLLQGPGQACAQHRNLARIDVSGKKLGSHKARLILRSLGIPVTADEKKSRYKST